MVILDSQILSYAVGEDHPLRRPCRRVLQAHYSGELAATTTVEVLQEFTHVRARRRSRSDAVALAHRFAKAFALLLTRPEDLDRGLHLFQLYPPLGAFDAVLAAVAINQEAEALLSGDQAFGLIPDLPWIDPATSAMNRLLRG